MKKLWQYGCSISLGEEATRPYGLLVSEYLNYEFIQQSESSSSNSHIALKFCEQYKQITTNDLVIFGWSHPNRQSWYNKKTERWEHMNYVQGKKRGSALVDSCKDYLVNQHSEYIEHLHTWYPRHIVETTCNLNNLRYMHIDCVPGMVTKLGAIGNNKESKSKYIADHLHPNDLGHVQIFQLIKSELDSIIHI
tara:strand:- start:22 stop:600 length:579 start_codon:yes stop_codon:yes gene_type:complete